MSAKRMWIFYFKVFGICEKFPRIYLNFCFKRGFWNFIYPHFPHCPHFAEIFAFDFVFAILTISFVNSLCYNRFSFENGKSGDDI